jgi:23S rRNA (uracil1939-C5)-methyltransferase
VLSWKDHRIVPRHIELTVEKLIYGGAGLSRDGGRVVLTPLVLPGERIVAEPVDKLYARLIKVVEPARERVAAPCPYYGKCGGCHYQHMPYEYQVSRKIEVLREALQRIGKFDAPDAIDVLVSQPWEYRNRTQLQVGNDEIGYYRMGSNDLCPVDHCPISSPRLNEAIRALAKLVSDKKWPKFIEKIELFTNEKDVQFNVLQSKHNVARHFFDWLSERLPGYAPGAIQYAGFRVSPRSFFQVNRYLTEALVDAALGSFSGSSALDIYAGVGLFARQLRNRFGQVTAVESASAAAADLRVNEPDVKTVRATAEEYLDELDAPPDFVVADPPREGLDKAVVRELIRLRPSRLHIISCDPATLARDMRALLDAGYRIEKMVMADLFPQTYHLETIVWLVC